MAIISSLPFCSDLIVSVFLGPCIARCEYASIMFLHEASSLGGGRALAAVRAVPHDMHVIALGPQTAPTQ